MGIEEADDIPTKGATIPNPRYSRHWSGNCCRSRWQTIPKIRRPRRRRPRHTGNGRGLRSARLLRHIPRQGKRRRYHGCPVDGLRPVEVGHEGGIGAPFVENDDKINR
jgi:hypothetical protein